MRGKKNEKKVRQNERVCVCKSNLEQKKTSEFELVWESEKEKQTKREWQVQQRMNGNQYRMRKIWVCVLLSRSTKIRNK